MSESHAPNAASFFLKGSLTRALFRWLSFQHFVQSGAELSLSVDHAQPTGLTGWLECWYQREYASGSGGVGGNNEDASALMYRGILLGGAALMGVVSMLGLLAVNLGEAVNIWVPVFLFAFLPLMFSVITAVVLLVQPERVCSSNAHSGGVLASIMRRLMSRDNGGWYRDSPRLLAPWVQWQLQRSACLFMVFALMTFFGFATFQDVRFVWSSTFIQQDATMLAVFSGIALPWEWLLGSLSLESIQASRLNPASVASVLSVEAVAAEPLWPFVIASILFYGLLPRLILLVVFRRQLRYRLASSIQESGSVETFLNRHQKEVSQNALVVEMDEVLSVPVLVNGDDAVGDDHRCQIGWRLSEAARQSCGPLARNLGLDEWGDDEGWLLSDHCVSQESVRVLVDFWQTPTGECEDCLQLLQLNNTDISLVLMGVLSSSERECAQLRSWQFFGEKCRVPIVSSTQESSAHASGVVSESLTPSEKSTRSGA